MGAREGILDMQSNSIMSLERFSELSGGRKVRDFVYYHARGYAAAGQYSLEFFRTQPTQKDFSGATGVEIGNLTTIGKFDEPFLLLGVGIWFQSLEADDPVKQTNTRDVYRSGAMELEINNQRVFEIAPLGAVGSPLYLTGFASTGTSGTAAMTENALPPFRFSLPIYCQENITLRAQMNWTSLVTVDTASRIGIFLIGQKFFKA